MPTYEYECTKCGEVLEVFQSITAAPKRRIKVDCEQCNNSAPVRRCIGRGAGVIFKGSGFYQTDYRSDQYTKDAKADKDASKKKSDKDGDGKKGEDGAKESKSVKKKTSTEGSPGD